jgi:uncharacterized protein YjiS (DUF1127 family)
MAMFAARRKAFDNRGGLAFIGGALIGGALTRFESESRRRDTEWALQALDEAELRDVGIRRDEIPAVAARSAGAQLAKSATPWGFFRSLHRSWMRRSAIRELESLSDRILYDIGVNRGDIPLVVDAAMVERKKASPRAGKSAAPVTRLVAPAVISAGAPVGTPKKAA